MIIGTTHISRKWLFQFLGRDALVTIITTDKDGKEVLVTDKVGNLARSQPILVRNGHPKKKVPGETFTTEDNGQKLPSNKAGHLQPSWTATARFVGAQFICE